MAFQINSRADAHIHNPSLPSTRQRNEIAHEHIARLIKRTEDSAIEPNETEIATILRELESVSSHLHRKLKYSINKDLNRVVIKIIDSETDKIIKELPPEELQRMSMRIREAIGLLVDEEI